MCNHSDIKELSQPLSTSAHLSYQRDKRLGKENKRMADFNIYFNLFGEYNNFEDILEYFVKAMVSAPCCNLYSGCKSD